MATMSALMCLATAIFFEARAEPVEGQMLVAETIMNRVDDSRYPDTVCDVVYEPYAFSFTHDGLSDNIRKYNTYYDKQAQDEAVLIASIIIDRVAPLSDVTHYHSVDVEPFWAEHYDYSTTVGNHVFYTNNTPWK